MTYAVFNWVPKVNSEGTSSFRVLSAQFGDGYAQEAGDGLNNETVSWTLEFVGQESQIYPIRDFLRQHQGFKPFWWTPHGESAPRLFVAREITVQPMGAKALTLRTKFEERFAP